MNFQFPWMRIAGNAVAGSVLALLAVTATARDFADFDQATWSLESGLPQRSVMAIAQDHGRYLWLGTQHGLSRFDGQQFREYAVEDHPGLAGNDISSLLSDEAGRLWVGTRKGLSIRENDAFRQVELPLATSNDGETVVNALLEMPNGVILAGTDDGLFRIDGDALQATRQGSDRVGGLAQIEQRIWIGGLGRYGSMDEDGNISEWTLPASLSATLITGFIAQPDGLWLASTNGLFRHTEPGPEAVSLHPGLNDTPITAQLADGLGDTWIATEQSLFRLRDGQLVERIDERYPGYHPQIQALLEDFEGNLWMGSAVDGLARYWPGRADRYSVAEGLNEALTWSLAPADEGALWVGTTDGLAQLHYGRFEPVLSGQELPHPHAYTLLAESDRLWIGTRRGLIGLDPATGTLSRPETLKALDPYQINGIVPARDHGRHFYLTSNGLYLLHDDGRLEHLDRTIGTRSVRQLKPLPDESLLVATESGVFHGQPGAWKVWGEKHGLPANLTVMALHIVDAKRIVIGSMDRGLFVGDGVQFNRLTRSQGLPSDSSYFITHDEHGFLWVASFQGVYRVPVEDLGFSPEQRPETVNAQMLISESGQHRGSQQGFCCNGAGHAKGLLRADGLWLPTRDGVIRLRPDSLDTPMPAPALHVERVRVGEQWQKLPQNGPLQPDLGARDLAFEFAAISLRDPQGVQLRYRLQGFHDWRQLPLIEQQRVEYTNLPPGRYRFEILAANGLGIQSSQAAGVDLEVPARFSETSGFYLLMALAAAGLLWLAYYWRKHQWQRRQQALEQEVERQTEALRQSNVQLQQANRALKQLSERDSLTGLHNRRYLEQRMPLEASRLVRLREQSPASSDPVIGFALIDVDHFKNINDQIGHGAGDQILEQMGERLRKLVRDTDYAIRWGGEEFLIVLPGLDRTDAETTLHRLQAGLRDRPYPIDGERRQTITVSIGYAELPLGSNDAVVKSDWETVVELADRALYQVKRHGRDGWAILRPDREQDARRLLNALRTDLSGCIARGDVQIEFHPTRNTELRQAHED
jgi:diguanylate cyclase (GGDEF)-like protein